MKTVTVRMPRVGAERLIDICRKRGMTIRGFFEAGILVGYEDELDPQLNSAQVQMWHSVWRMERTAGWHDPDVERVQIKVSLDDEVYALLKRGCEQYGVTISATLARLVMPWEEDTGPACLAYRQSAMNRITRHARERDFDRRHAGTGLHRH